MSSDRLIYVPLGGAGEIGMNAYVYGYGPAGKERLILVDLGVTFPDMDTTPGVDLILPDITWLKENRDRLDAIFITHAHEDHVGAVGHFYDQLGVPIYARAFTANIARRKMEEHGHPESAVRTVSAWPETVTAGPFTVGFVPVSHSIPESSGLVIDTPAGRIVHTGDFKIDETPGVGEPFDRALWASIGAGGVRALMCDSTNVFSPHAGRSESSLGPEIESLIAGAKGMFVATTFASNVARVKTLAEAGERAGRSVCLLGRAMRRIKRHASDDLLVALCRRELVPRHELRRDVLRNSEKLAPRRHRPPVPSALPYRRGRGARARHARGRPATASVARRRRRRATAPGCRRRRG